MSTPIPTTPPKAKEMRERLSSDELRAEMQRMIDLQYETQIYQKNFNGSNFIPPPPPHPSVRESSIGGLISIKSPPPSARASSLSYANLYEEEVGKGTLFIPDKALVHQGGTSVGTALSQTKPQSKSSAQHLDLATYGTMQEDQGTISLTHDFYYNNPDYHDPFRHENVEDTDRTGWRRSSFIQMFFLESLHRSFCFGAIDGMLTGSSIVATFCGMGIIAENSSLPVRRFVAFFCSASCLADACCMAIGHLWTTYVLALSHAESRNLARQQLQENKHDAKGQIVDILLKLGVLKIDAMSIADTLEGYPDLFVSVMIGDSLSMTSERHTTASSSNIREAFPSYGRLTDYDMDPEARQIHSAMNDAKIDSLFTLLGFASFAVVPSIVLYCMPIKEVASESTPTVHSMTLVIVITSSIMWCLGLWKSTFLERSSAIFGIETVVVLLSCIAVGYGVGALLSNFIPEILLNVVDTH